jgi:hypothetical protein
MANERDAVVQRARQPSEAALRELHHRRGDLDYAGVEVHRGTVGQLKGSSSAVHERHVDESTRVPEELFGLCRNAVDEQRELGLSPPTGRMMRSAMSSPFQCLSACTVGTGATSISFVF